MVNNEGNRERQSYLPEQIDLFDLICQLWRGKVVIIACVIIGLIPASIYLISDKQHWTSTTVIVPPDAGQVADYTNTMLALYPVEQLHLIKDNNAPMVPLIVDIQISAFERFVNLASLLASQQGISVEYVTPVTGQPVYGPLPVQVSATADSAEKAKAALETFLTEADQKSSGQLRDDLLANIVSRRETLIEQLAVQEKVLEEQKTRRLAELDLALEQAQQAGIVEPKVPHSGAISSGSLYLLGRDTLAAMRKNTEAQTLSFPKAYDRTREQILRLDALKSEQMQISTYRALQAPNIPDTPDSTKSKLMVVLVVLFGGIFGAGIVLVRNAVRRYRAQV